MEMKENNTQRRTPQEGSGATLGGVEKSSEAREEDIKEAWKYGKTRGRKQGSEYDLLHD